QEVGQSIVEEDMFTPAKDLNDKIVLPQDFMVLESTGQTSIRPASGIEKADFILDIGPKTTADFIKIIEKAGSVLWNGPMGKFEDKNGSAGTEAIARAIAGCSGQTLAGGGETVAIIEQLGLVKKIGFVSVGGGALLTNLAGGPMPALDALKK
ncbi:MAG: phosphoglycerate kinase, partial [Candidatus Komeilibacteria bacterium]|nr:phosphoglycerate kinase [Candidatus Komeilibacteria bacterium]